MIKFIPNLSVDLALPSYSQRFHLAATIRMQFVQGDRDDVTHVVIFNNNN